MLYAVVGTEPPIYEKVLATSKTAAEALNIARAARRDLGAVKIIDGNGTEIREDDLT